MNKENEEPRGGVTIKELKTFLNKLPDDFDNFSMVNGEVAGLDGEFYVRVDKPVIHLEIDETNNEFLILNQSEEEITKIMEDINGNPESTE